MATVTFQNVLNRNFDILDDLLDFATEQGGTSTSYRWDTSAGARVTLSGTGFTYGLTPIGGTVTTLSIDLENDGINDIVVTGLNSSLTTFTTPLLGGALNEEGESELVWEEVLRGEDTIDFGTGWIVNFASDRVWVANSTMSGPTDTFIGYAYSGSISGDYYDVQGSTDVTGGDDELSNGASYAVGYGLTLAGDAITTWASSRLTGGDDTMELYGQVNAAGDVYRSDGTLFGGDDVLTAYGNASLGANLYGDAQILRTGSLTGGNDTIWGGSGANSIYGDVGNIVGGTLIGGDDELHGQGGNDTIFGQGGNDTLEGGSDDDRLDGGDGENVAVYSGVWADYSITALSGGGYSVLDNVADRDGRDTITDIDWLVFSAAEGNDTISLASPSPWFAQNDAPVPENDTNTADPVAEDGDLFATGNVLANDWDPDDVLGDTRTVVGVGAGTGATVGVHPATDTETRGTFGTLRIGADGAYTYTLDNADPDTQAIRPGEIASDVFTYRVTDAKGLADTAQITIAIGGDTAAPTITSNGAGASAAVTIAENSRYVTTLTAFDPDSAPVAFQLAGADAGRFVLVGNQLRFASSPDFEAHADADRDGTYDVSIRARVGTALDTQSLSITVGNVAGNTIAGTSRGDRIDTARTVNGLGATAEEDTINGRGGNDTIKAAGGNDTVIGGSGNDKLYGDAGNDLLRGDSGKDRLDGGTGTDTADYAYLRQSLVLTLNGSKDATVRIGGVSEDTLRNIENVEGGSRSDRLTGDKLANWLQGNSGNDRLDGGKGRDLLDGGKGRDVLIGGDGSDTLTGGASADKFVFDAKLRASNIDTITDFRHDSDRIQLDDAIFKAIGSSLSGQEFYAMDGATAAHDRSDRIIYDTGTGRLYYDADGSKSGSAAIHFATLSSKPLLDHGDFSIV